MKLFDGLENVVTGMGGSSDKTANSRYASRLIDDQELINAYRYAWLPRKIIDVPANDAVAKWRTWDADADAVARIEAIENRLLVKRKILAALISARLYGGAAVYIDTGSQTPENPISDSERIQRLIVFQRDEVTLPGTPYDFLVTGDEMCKVRNREVHKSRLVRFYGERIPGDDGWADSVLIACMDAIKNADSIASSIANLVFEAKVDVFKIPNLMENLGNSQYESDLMRRLQLAQVGKSTVNGLMMDMEEDYQQKTVNFSGLDQLHLTALQVVAGASRIPATRLLGRSASGLNSTGDNEIREYYDTILTQQELVIRPAMEVLDRLIALEAGASEATYGWVSLWQMDEAQEAQVRSSDANAIAALMGTELFRADELFRPAVNLMARTIPGFDEIMEDDIEGGDDDIL